MSNLQNESKFSNMDLKIIKDLLGEYQDTSRQMKKYFHEFIELSQEEIKYNLYKPGDLIEYRNKTYLILKAGKEDMYKAIEIGNELDCLFELTKVNSKLLG